MPPELEKVAANLVACALLLMVTFFLTPYIPQLLGGTFWEGELARIWGFTNLVVMFNILRQVIIFAYYMLLLMVGDLRLTLIKIGCILFGLLLFVNILQ